MQTSKQIKFVGVFQDNISPTIKKINNSIIKLNRTITALQVSTKSLSHSFSKVDTGLEDSIKALRQYRTELAKANKSQRLFKPSSTGGGGGGGGSSPPSSSGGGMSLGSMVKADLISNAIIMGFSKGTEIIRSTFNQIFAAFQERIDDQMSDIQSAGGIFSLAKRKNLKDFGSSFDDAMGFQKELNASLAKAAGALPGSTSQYVQTAKGLTDGLMTTIGKDGASFKAAFGNGSENMKDAMTNALTDLTTKGVLLGQGQQGGIPLPVLLERILSQEKVNVQSMASTFAALEQNPLLKGALEEAEAKINATGANTAGRLTALMEALDNALPVEQINAMKRATSGVIEAYRSFFKDPESGLFGLGRAINMEVKEYSSTTGLYTGVGKSISLFDSVNDIFSNIAVVFSEMLPAIMEIWDPLRGIAELFLEFREQSFSLFAKFNGATNLVKDTAEKYGVKIDDFQSGIRAGILALSQWLGELGVFSNSVVELLAGTALKKETLSASDLKYAITTIGKGFLQSDWLKNLARSFGAGAARVIVGIQQAISGAAMAAEGNTALGALFEGFSQEGGGEALKTIMKTIFQGAIGFIGNQLKQAFENDPIGVAMTGATVWSVLNPDKLVGAMFSGFGSLFNAANLLKGTGLKTKVLSLMKTLGGTILTFAKAIPGAAAAGTAAAIGAVAVLVHFLKEPIIRLLDAIRAWTANLVSIAPGWLQPILRALKSILDVFLNLVDALVSIVASLGKFIVGVFTFNFSTIKESVEDFGYVFKDMWGEFTNYLLDWFGGLLEKFGVELEYYDRQSEREARKARRKNTKLLKDAYNLPSSFGGAGSSAGGTGAVNPVRGNMTVNLTGGKQLNLPAAALKGQGSMNLSTMLPLLQNLGKQFDPGNPEAGLVQDWRDESGKPGQLYGGNHSAGSKHYAFSGIDIGEATTPAPVLAKMFNWLHKNIGGDQEGGSLNELFYDPMGKYIAGGITHSGAIGGHQRHLHIGWKPGANLPANMLNQSAASYQGNMAPFFSTLRSEMNNMGAGNNLAIANSGEAIMNPEQIRAVVSGIAGGNSGVTIQNMVVNGNNARELAQQVVEQIDLAIQARRRRSALA